MATTARSVLRQYLAEAMGFYFSGSATSTGDTTSLIDTKVMRYDTGRLTNLWAYILTATQSTIVGTSRRVSSAAAATGDMTLATALAATTTSGDTYELLPYDPEIMHDAISQALRSVWPKRVNGKAARGLYLPTTDETLVIDNLLTNSSFETFSTTFEGWDNIGTPTLSALTTTPIHGVQAARIVASGATEGIEQDVWDKVQQIEQAAGKVLRVRGWVWGNSTESVRLRLTFDGSTYTNGPWHSGDNEWEGPSIHQIDASIPTTSTEATVSCEVVDGQVGYFDLVLAWVDPIREYTMPTSFYPNGPSRLLRQRYLDEPRGEYTPYDTIGGASGYVLRAEGMARLSNPTTDAGTTEVDATEAEFVVAEAAMHMHRILASDSRNDRAFHNEESQRWAAIADERRAQLGHLGMGGDTRRYWSISPEDSRILYLLDR